MSRRHPLADMGIRIVRIKTAQNPKKRAPITIKQVNEIDSCRYLALAYAGREDFDLEQKQIMYRFVLALNEYLFFLLDPVNFPIDKVTKRTARWWMKHCVKIREDLG